ncbi:DUF2384 domain-containing protein [Pseudomonas sp. ABC1]|uniref:type II RES/Xre toxin-antitoxin system antitoxin n=1 Tax=Pseudomonas sp. ABC1 TaxID=2748080 RepID=UPI0015C3163C|nr:antitoxin Xre/MbcA/ParS toxin-binding domain-containing protein [Pseudomonas sp. ABC1]QLF94694.1 DUF2384 domain-containing protein [Pseudomonas sp. ABC1]
MQPLARSSTSGTHHLHFWIMAHALAQQTEHQRLHQISHGLDASWLVAVRSAFDMKAPALALLVNLSTSTLERRIKGNVALDPVASERIDRLAQIAVLAEEVFEDKAIATDWLASENDTLGGKTPLSLCETELGARQVRRVLHAIEWGGVA